MADSTIDSEKVVLVDGFPGYPGALSSTDAKNGFTDASHHNVATAQYPIGTKIQVQNSGTGIAGPSIFMYGQIGTQNGDVAIAAKTICIFDSASDPYELTNDPDSAVGIGAGPIAVALSAMTDAYYGWFWVGGVCPEAFVSGLGGNYPTDSTVVAGTFCAGNLTADAIGLSGTRDTTTQTPSDLVAGYALAADAA